MSIDHELEAEPVLEGELLPAETGIRAALGRRVTALAPAARTAAIATAGATVLAAAAVVTAKAAGSHRQSGSLRGLKRGERMPRIESTRRVLIEVHQLAER